MIELDCVLHPNNEDSILCFSDGSWFTMPTRLWEALVFTDMSDWI